MGCGASSPALGQQHGAQQAMGHPGQSNPAEDVSDDAKVQQKSKAADDPDELLRHWGDDAEVDKLVDDALLDASMNGVVGWLGKAVSTFGEAQGAPKRVDVQELKVDQMSDAQKKLIKYSFLGQVLVDGAGMALAALPFGGVQVASLLAAAYGRTVQTARNGSNCRRLLKQIQLCDRQLARAVVLVGKKMKQKNNDSAAPSLPKDLMVGLHTITVVVQRAAVFISGYNERGSLMAFIASSSDRATFTQLEAMLRDAMQGAGFGMAVEALDVETYVDESAALRKAVCEAAGILPVSPESAEKALEQLQATDPKQLRSLLEKTAPFSTKVLMQELDALSKRVDEVEADIADIKVTLLQLQQRHEEASKKGPEGLAPFLQKWWNEQGWRVEKSVSSTMFLNKLMAWLQQNGPDALAAYDAAMMKDKVIVQVQVMGDGAQVFLRLVVMERLDEDHDGQVTRSELYRLQVLAKELAELPDVCLNPPDSLLTLLDILFMGLDRTPLLKADAVAVGMPAVDSKLVAKVQAALKVADAISSYKVSSLLDEYVEGSRQKLYARVDAWLDAISTSLPAAGHDDERSSAPAREAAASRMLLLLADAGMGKSVFSAVMHTKLAVRTNRDRKLVVAHHFFKVGQARASGKVAILCLVHQLASVLDGMAAQLESVVQEHGDASNLSMADACDKYLVQPLLALAAPGQPPMPGVLLLLDAMDEADDGSGHGWQPVAALIAREFLKLPPSVRVLVTGRPEVGGKFKAWRNPETIEPTSADNFDDMKLVMRARLTSRNVLAAGQDLGAATEVMLDKSKGQFIYIKFAFEALSARSSWTVAQLRAPGVLPTGLAGAFQLALGTLQAALQREKPELLPVLRRRMLPVLVVACEPLTVAQLAWLAGAEEQQVDELLGYSANLFPRRMAGADGQLRVFPYHKTVLDWLTSEVVEDVDASGGRHHIVAYNTGELGWLTPEEVPSSDFRVDPAAGHALAAAACHAVAMAMPLSDPRAPHDASPARPPLDGNQAYALRHTVAHLRETQLVDSVNSLVMHFGFWEWVHAAGMGPSVVRDLAHLAQVVPAQCAGLVKDVLRWLRLCSAFLTKHPAGTLQLACDAPRNSLVAKRAAALPTKPLAQLLTKESDWSATIAVLAGHTSYVNCVAIDPNGKSIVSASGDKTIRLWDMQSGECKATFEGHTDEVASVAISRDGKTIVSGSKDKTVRVWDLESGECKSTLQGHTHEVHSVAISPDGKTIVSGSVDRTVRVWELESGECKSTLQGHTDYVRSVAISPDGKTIVSGSDDKTIRVWDLQSGECKSTLQGHTDDVNSVAISPDGKTIVSGSFDDTVRVWDLESGECKRTLKGHSAPVNSVAISPDGKTIVSGSGHPFVNDNTIRVWDLESGECKSTLQGHTGAVESVAISPDGKTFVSGSRDNTVRVWDLESGECKSTLQGHTHEVHSVAISPDGKTIVSGSRDKTVRVWDLESGECKSTLQGHTHEVHSVAISPDGKTIVSGSWDSTVRVWELESGECKSTLQGHTDRVFSVAISPDGKSIVSGSEDSTVRVWELESGESGECKSTLQGHTNCVSSVAISPDGKTIVSGSWDNTVRVWDLESGKPVAILTGEQGKEQLKAAITWREMPGASSDVIIKTDDGEARVLAILGTASTGSELRKLFSIFLYPPFQAHVETIRISTAAKRVATFTQGLNRFLVYKLS